MPLSIAILENKLEGKVMIKSCRYAAENEEMSAQREIWSFLNLFTVLR